MRRTCQGINDSAASPTSRNASRCGCQGLSSAIACRPDFDSSSGTVSVFHRNYGSKIENNIAFGMASKLKSNISWISPQNSCQCPKR